MIRFCVVGLTLLAMVASAQDRSITLASTTSTQNSGLYDHLLPLFEAETGIAVQVIAVGTGQALRIARNGDADALMVHHRPSEDAFVAEGYGRARVDVMYNDFVLVGPRDDPAGIRNAQSVREALALIAASGAPFASRGDDSGTHKKELGLWAAAGLTPQAPWYLETGSGMGATLNTATALGAYSLSDRGTWISFGNKQEHRLLLSGDPALHNPYGAIVVNPERHPHVKADLAQTFVDWLVSDTGQEAIGAFLIDGQQPFCPDAPSFRGARLAAGIICPSPLQGN
ncbi:MAG: substrate-binding domain-containing protein [Pseudomonadota bacterium]